jgi:tripartite-type tricarboxylate transporter receptor subunit TctC
MKLTHVSITMLLLIFVGCAESHADGANDPQHVATTANRCPANSVRIIEPFGAGGGPDLLARALAPKLSELWGLFVTVENVPGAGATAGPALAAKSRADGCTLLLNTSAQAYSAAIAKNLPYDPLKDFIPVAALTSQPYVLLVGTPVGVTTVAQLIAAATAKPGELRYGYTGVGAGTHLAIMKFNRDARITAVDVPPQPTDAIADVVAATVEGRITYMFAPISITLPQIRDGKLFPLGVTTTRRSTLLPDVPTINEAGVAGFDFPIWYGIWVPAGTPARVVDRLAKDLGRVFAEPELRDWVAVHGGELMRMTQPEFARFVRSEAGRAARLMKSTGASPR